VSLPALVLVHGGGLAADSWELTVGEIRRQAPDLTVFAVDLPGRRGKHGDLHAATIADFVKSIVGDIADAGLRDVVIVGHSMAGLTVPCVVAELGSSRVREMILAAAVVPADGQSIADCMTGFFAPPIRRDAKRGGLNITRPFGARVAYLNGVPRARREFMKNKLYPESARMLGEKVVGRALPDAVPRTWILTQRDRMLSEESQHRGIEALGGVQEVIPIDTCHLLMVSEPERLAQILVERCRLYTT
jgi:pimeloyl-ACP methyl ester carboxylesterase